VLENRSEVSGFVRVTALEVTTHKIIQYILNAGCTVTHNLLPPPYLAVNMFQARCRAVCLVSNAVSLRDAKRY